MFTNVYFIAVVYHSCRLMKMSPFTTLDRAIITNKVTRVIISKELFYYFISFITKRTVMSIILAL